MDDLYRKSAVAYVTEVLADEEGYISELPALAFGKYAMKLGLVVLLKLTLLIMKQGLFLRKKWAILSK